MFNREGCGQEEKARDELEQKGESSLSRSGWEDRAAVIDIDPELENWVFNDLREVDASMGWRGNHPPLRTWLVDQNYLATGEIKPARPKEAMEAALRDVRRPRSSSIYGRLAEHVGIGRCTDGAFQKQKARLRAWFPAPD
jgi:hypothetical protein